MSQEHKFKLVHCIKWLQMLQNDMQLIEHGDAMQWDQLAYISQTTDLIKRIASVAVPINDALNQRRSANCNSCAICVQVIVNKCNEYSLLYSRYRKRPA
jgi:hypothetical protein